MSLHLVSWLFITIVSNSSVPSYHKYFYCTCIVVNVSAEVPLLSFIKTWQGREFGFSWARARFADEKKKILKSE